MGSLFCLSEHNVGDLAVVGYDNVAIARWLNLTTVEQHFERLEAEPSDCCSMTSKATWPRRLTARRRRSLSSGNRCACVWRGAELRHVGGEGDVKPTITAILTVLSLLSTALATLQAAEKAATAGALPGCVLRDNGGGRRHGGQLVQET